MRARESVPVLTTKFSICRTAEWQLQLAVITFAPGPTARYHREHGNCLSIAREAAQKRSDDATADPVDRRPLRGYKG